MGKFHNNGQLIEISDCTEKNSRNVTLIPSSIRYDNTQKEKDSIQQAINEKNTYENTTTNDMEVEGTDKSPEKFNNKWYNENPKLHLKLREAIKKDFQNMEKNHLWRAVSKKDVPDNRRLLGAKRIFKVNKNDIFKA